MYKSPRYFVLSFKSIGHSVEENKFQIDFQDGRHDGHLGSNIRTVLPVFDVRLSDRKDYLF